MKPSLLEKLFCPECQAGFDVRVFRENAPSGWREIQDGALLCRGCRIFYIISHYVPRFLPDACLNDADFSRRYKIELDEVRKTHHAAGADPANVIAKLQLATIRNFGWEWKTWNQFGWGDAVGLEQTRDIFKYKVLMRPGELAGKLVLDAGCGNGRYTAVASEFGGEVIGVDLSDAVDVAWENTKADPKIHIIQGDLFKLPFRPATFDFIFSNGVLMHTGDAHRAFVGLSKLLKPDGAITVHLYHKGNAIYETVDYSLRAVTTRLPLSWVYAWSCVMAAVARALPKKFVDIVLNGFIRIERHAHYVFDWYTAPIATHHTYPEVYGWLKECHLHLVEDHNATAHPWRKWVFPFLFLTVKAQKQAVAGEPIHSRI